jgi:hypothetical protein
VEHTFIQHHFLIFQVIIEGVWGNNRVSGYVAVDDVTVFEGDCDSEFNLIIKDAWLNNPPKAL